MKKSLSVRLTAGILVLMMFGGMTVLTGCNEGKSVKSEKKGPFERNFPVTNEKTRVFVDQLPGLSSLHEKQLEFIANKYVGSQKMNLDFTNAIRKFNPDFIMLHYHLAIWQSYVDYIMDGENWGNDLEEVSGHDDWFMHRFDPATGEVYKGQDNWVYAFDDHKYLMNITNEDFYKYFLDKMIKQCKAGKYDGIFLDSYHTAVLNFYLKEYPEYRGTAAGLGTYPELGDNVSWREASEKFMKRLTEDLNKAGLYSLPNVGNFNTGWDETDYTLSNGGMTEGAFDYGSLDDWKLGMNGHLKLIEKDLVDMCQEYLNSDDDYVQRLYFLGNYLLLRGKYTYINYFNNSSFKYYPEYDLDMGKPLQSAGDDIGNLEKDGLYVREFKKGIVVLCPEGAQGGEYKVPAGDYSKVVLEGGGDVNFDGELTGKISYEPVSGTITLEPGTAAILMKKP